MTQKTEPLSGELQATTKMIHIEDDLTFGSFLLDVIAQEMPRPGSLATDNCAALKPLLAVRDR